MNSGTGLWQLFWREELPYLLLLAAASGLALARRSAEERAVARHTALFLLLCIAGEILGAALQAYGFAQGGAILRDAAIVATGLAVIRFAGLTLFRVLLPLAGLRAPRIAEDVILVAAYAAWGLVRLRLAGMDLASLVTTSAVVTAVLAFAMQDTLGNVLGGLFLELDDSIAIGEWVRLDDVSGRVSEIHWRHTTIRTRSGEKVKVPNSTLMKSRFTVIGNPDAQPVRWRRAIAFDVALDVAPSRVLEAAQQALANAEIPNVARDPQASCVLLDLAAGCGRYALRYWLTDPQADDPTDSAVRVHLVDALERAGIGLAIPQRLVHQVKETEARANSLKEREVRRRVGALEHVEIFAKLTPAERTAIAERLMHAPFAAGDVVTRQGAVAHWLYLLVQGEAEVWVEAPGAPRRLVAALNGGQVFGEMGMMTGEPRSATVIAKTDVEAYRLDKDAFAQIIRSRPQIAEDISRVLTARAGELHHVIEDAKADAGARSARRDSLLRRIREFFALEDVAPGVDSRQDAPAAAA